jgi:hypothetical protein
VVQFNDLSPYAGTSLPVVGNGTSPAHAQELQADALGLLNLTSLGGTHALPLPPAQARVCSPRVSLARW